MIKNELLLIPDKADLERDSVAKEWIYRGGEVKRIGKFWVKPETNGKRVSIYGYDTFVLVLAQVLGLTIKMPRDEDIAAVEYPYLKREVVIREMNSVYEIEFPKFIKPLTPKLFAARIFESLNELEHEIKDLNKSESLICSDIIVVESELRSFILNGEIKDLAFYEGSGDIEEAREFINQFLKETEIKFPISFVLDIGYNKKLRWFIIEFNSSWGAGLNSCDPKSVIECIREAVNN